MTMKKTRVAARKAMHRNDKHPSHEAEKRQRKTSRDVKPKNVLFPGRPNYVGPQHGLFAMLHHKILFEMASYSGVGERVRYVRQSKPQNEKAIRLHNMIRLPEYIEKVYSAIQALDSERQAELREIGAGWTTESEEKMRIRKLRDKLLTPAVLSYVRKHIPDHAWVSDDGTGRPGLKFPTYAEWEASQKR